MRRTGDLNALFHQQQKWDLPAWMHEHLHAIDERLCWEYGPPLKGSGHRLVITPESDRQLRPLVQTILDRAPTVEGWEFYPYRPAEDVQQTILTVQGRTGVDITQAKVQVTLGQGNTVDLVWQLPPATPFDQQLALHAAFVATETLLGEEVLDKWIGAIEATPPAKGLFGWLKRRNGRTALPLDRVKDTVSSLIDHARDQLPPRPLYEMGLHEENHPWSSFKLEPQEQSDYPQRSDLFVAISAYPQMLQAAQGQPTFASERFSRHGERYCYIKIDGTDGLAGTAFRDREEIETALNVVLTKTKLGCTVGGGTGLRYSYVDLALTDVDKGVDVVRQLLRKGKVPKRTWILFFDAEWADEWVNIWEDGDPPPSMS